LSFWPRRLEFRFALTSHNPGAEAALSMISSFRRRCFFHPYRLVVSLWIACCLTAWPGWAQAGEGAADHCVIPASAPCIETPGEYKEYWDNYQVGCVDPSLYVTVPWGYDSPSGGTTGDTHLYPSEFALAWANGSTNLEKYLELRCLYEDDPMKARVGIGSYIGFPVPIKNSNPDAASAPISVFVYQLEALQPDAQALAAAPPHLRVPSFETWFHLLEEALDLRFDLETQKEVVLRYSNIPSFKRVGIRRQVDAVRVFTKLTGCKRSRDWRKHPGFPPTSDLRGCNDSYLRAREAAGNVKVGPGGPTTQECFENFKASFEGSRDAAAFRGVLELCQDANALNTGVGLGYNPMPNPFVCKRWKKQTVADKYTGREYIVPNGALRPEDQGSSWEVVTLEPVADARYNLHAGYCR